MHVGDHEGMKVIMMQTRETTRAVKAAPRLQNRDRDGNEGGAGSAEKRRCRVISTSRKQRSIQLLSGETRHCGGSAAVHDESFADSGRTSGDLATRLLPD